MTALWQECLGQLQHELPAQQYNTWIRPLVASADDGQFVLSAPNRFVKDWVKDKYLQRIQEILSELNGGRITHVELAVGESQPMFRPQVKSRPTSPPPRPAPRSNSQANYGFAAPRGSAPPMQGELLDDVPEPVPQRAVTASHRPEPVRSRERNVQVEGGLKHQSFLNETFTFDTFVEGKSNQLAHAAARQVAENAGGSYNPLFIYGGVGLGKTHLMHAVGNYLQKKNGNAKVLYVHSERFVQDMVKALQLNAINEFKRFYRGLDALLIDDIQFFAGKERSQEEFFHTFNALLEGGQQMILTCDRYPKEINGLEERLKSRFGWGLTVAVEPPELETRVAILMKKAEQTGVHLPDDAAFFIAQKIRSNVR